MRKNRRKRRRGVIGFLIRYWRLLSRYLLTGLLVWVPLFITIWVVWFFISRFVLGTEHFIENALARLHTVALAHPALSGLVYFNYYPGMGTLIVIALFLTTGYVARFIIGKRIIEFGERIVARIPLISRIYRAVQQIRDTFIGRRGAVFQEVCLVEYPRPGMHAIAFITARDQNAITNTIGRELVAVFVPTTPNPTSGYLIYLPEADVKILDISVEDAMKTIVSAGAYSPASTRQALAAQQRLQSDRMDPLPVMEKSGDGGGEPQG